MRPITMILAATALAATAMAQTPAPAAIPSSEQVRFVDDDGRGTAYIVDKSDNICGLDEPRALSNPAKVDYEALLEATAEVKEIHKRRIDPESAKGIKLMTDARRKVLAACDSVRSDEGYCSIWKKISRRDKTPIDDITAKVKSKIDDDQVDPA